jgi:hypothetical protein
VETLVEVDGVLAGDHLVLPGPSRPLLPLRHRAPSLPALGDGGRERVRNPRRCPACSCWIASLYQRFVFELGRTDGVRSILLEAHHQLSDGCGRLQN